MILTGQQTEAIYRGCIYAAVAMFHSHTSSCESSSPQEKGTPLVFVHPLLCTVQCFADSFCNQPTPTPLLLLHLLPGTPGRTPALKQHRGVPSNMAAKRVNRRLMSRARRVSMNGHRDGKPNEFVTGLGIDCIYPSASHTHLGAPSLSSHKQLWLQPPCPTLRHRLTPMQQECSGPG